jgi:hypothetical protein
VEEASHYCLSFCLFVSVGSAGLPAQFWRAWTFLLPILLIDVFLLYRRC